MDKSYLFVPGDRTERFEKALATPADRIIVDLEDAVPPANKVSARTAVLNWLSADRPVLIRINARDTAWYEADSQLISHPGVAGLVVPKAEQLDGALLNSCGEQQKFLIALVETAVGIQNLPALAGSRAVQRFAFGALDFQVDLGITGEGDALLLFRSLLVLHSRLGNLLAPIDGVTVDLSDEAVLRADTEYAKKLGFGAKLCIHPKQVDLVNAVFSPTTAERDWAQRVLAAVKTSNGAAVAVDGKMVDKPIILKAERILASA